MERKAFKLVILSRSFAKASDEPLKYLKDAGIMYELKRNSEAEDEEKIASLIGDADAVIVGSDRIRQLVFERCKNLKVISKHGVGLDGIDLEEAAKRNIMVTTTHTANTESVADHTWLLILAASRDLGYKMLHFDTVETQWNNSKLGMDVCDKTIGLYGYGKIGRAVALRARGFRNKILVYDPNIGEVKEDGLEIVKVDFTELMSESDIISLHAPLTDETKYVINRETIQMMKDGVIIINTSRGGLIDEKALLEALRGGKVKAAGLDVFLREPPIGNDLLKHKNVIATPHISAHSFEANFRMGMAAAENVVKMLNNQ
jgi:D-3-phosphoglycerate dehydrogenase